MFATSTLQGANLGGLGGGDALCQARAAAAALGGSFKAFMVDDNTKLERLEHPNAPFMRLDGVKVADDWADLADESSTRRCPRSRTVGSNGCRVQCGDRRGSAGGRRRARDHRGRGFGLDGALNER